MKRLAFDLETDGLLDEVSRVHCLVIKDLDSTRTERYRQNDRENRIEDGLRELACADELWGHNIQGYDLKVIRKLYPAWTSGATVRDTYILSELIWTEVKNADFRQLAKWQKERRGDDFNKGLIGRHSLEAWGQRLGFPKDDYKKRCESQGIDPWVAWNQEMENYCVIDVEVTCRLIELIQSKGFGSASFDIEHGIRPILRRQEAFGFPFKQKEAAALYAELSDLRAQLSQELIDHFGAFYLPNGKRKCARKTIGYKDRMRADLTEGAEYTPVKLVEFNPGSRDHIGRCLMKRYGWKPQAFGADGKPTVDESTLKGLKYTPVRTIIRFLTVDKRIGMLAEGKQGWLKKVKKDGRMHGRVSPNGTVTGRMAHSSPNLGQVQSVKSDKNGPVMGEAGGWGYEFRALFVPPPEFTQVGIDASGLELRCLGHYMARWDDGAYVDIILNGDIHNANAEALGLDPKGIYHVGGKPMSGRDLSKRFIYAYLYGAGDALLGALLGKGKRYGGRLRRNFQKNLPALGTLIEKVQGKARTAKRIKGLDGRWLNCRAEHSALNTLLQSCGAILMKQALVILDDRLQRAGFQPGEDYEFMANVHDEWQIAARPDIAEEVGHHGKEAIRLAGECFDFRCPLDGEYKIGSSWAECH